MNINNINVNKYPVSQMFDPDSKVIFEIPKYQREYTWGSREWEALFDDLTENDDGYFLGSIICINSATDTINAPKFEVVDGQQRLTTLSLFLAALYFTLNSYKDLLDEDQQSDILQLKRKLVLKKTQSDIRVVPQVQGSNRDDFMGLLAEIGIIPKRPMPKFAGLRRIVKAYNYFKKRINAVLADAPDKVLVMFRILDKVNSAILVMIEVSNHADAYTLFESLNNRGTPSADRPQGEWIDAEIPLESGGSMPIQACNLCKTFYPLAYTGCGHRFCPHCGARMKGADDE